jgi:hypothetical protein
MDPKCVAALSLAANDRLQKFDMRGIPKVVAKVSGHDGKAYKE